jgi:hypothetical protein
MVGITAKGLRKEILRILDDIEEFFLSRWSCRPVKAFVGSSMYATVESGILYVFVVVF